jgi:uncharacterized protein DUF6448
VNTKLLLPLTLAALLSPVLARAHCDTLDGPVVVAARAALDSGKLNPVLAWVPAEGEAEIREAFAKARAARKASKEARDVADQWFFETLVRVHRASEGAPYTGLKPAGQVEPAVAVVDQAIAKRDPKAIEALLDGAVHRGLETRWNRLAAEKPPADDVAAGRRWVAAYVPFVHWVEGVHAAAASPDAHGHGAPAREAHADHTAHDGAAPPHGAARHHQE